MNIGDQIEHEDYGRGIISEVTTTSFKAIFVLGGERQISKTSDSFEITQTVEVANQNNTTSGGLNVDELEYMLVHVLDKYNGLQEEVELGEKWDGGTMVLQPADDNLQNKEIPIETFFHKIVMLRDRLRVLEQNINSHKNLSDEEKVNLQQYITKCYGSLTTFNVLFKTKEDYFVGESKKH